MDVIEILRKLAAFNTIDDKENMQIIEWIKNYLSPIGFNFMELTDEITEKKCLVAQIGNNAQLAFGGHLDTVNATEEWTRNPFDLSVENDKIYGLGVCDMKGGIAAFLKACSTIRGKTLKNGVKLFLTYDEEKNFSGIKLLLKEKIETPKYLILSEPTDLQPVIATKGCLEVKVIFYGRSAHSSTPAKGKNAIVEANKFIEELLEFSKELQQEKDDIFSVPYTTINIGKIEGGDAVNKVPDRCYVEFDARTIKKEHNLLIENRIKCMLKKYDCKFNIDMDIPSNINTDNKMIESIEKLTKNTRRGENYVTEASFLSEAESVILGVGPVTAHQSDEYIEKKKLNELVLIYEKILDKYCL